MRVLLAIALLGLCAPALVRAQAGFTTTNDVSNNAKIDLDQKELEAQLGETPADFASARAAYTNKQTADTKSLQELSTTLGAATMARELKYKSDSAVSVVQSYATYWGTNPLSGTSVACRSGAALTGCPNYADVMISTYFDGTGHAASLPDGSRSQVIKKGTAYHAAWLEAVNQLSHAVAKAKMVGSDMMLDGKSPSEAVAMHVDLAWAYYTGSEANWLSETLARKRAAEFRTCATIPSNVLSEFQAAQKAASTANFNAAALETAATNIVPLITAPLVQGCIRYITLEDGKVNDMSTNVKAEMFVFCAALLPQMAAADAAVVRDMIDWKKTGSSPTVNTAAALRALSNSYPRMGISTSVVGDFDPRVGETGSNPCSGCALAASVTTALAAALLAVYATF